MTTIADLVAKLRADTSGFDSSMGKSAQKGADAAKKVSSSWTDATKKIKQSSAKDVEGIAKTFDSLKMAAAGGATAIAAVVGVSSITAVAKIADQYNVLEARIKNITAASGDFKTVNEQLYKIAQANGAAFSDTADTFQGLQRTAKELGASNSDMLKLTDTVQKLGVLGGSTSEQMKNGMLQFTQMMAGGTAHAEEMNSVLENTPEVANRIAQGMGMTVGQLRAAVKAGDVLSKDVFEALMKQAPQIAEQFKNMPVSMAQGTQMLQNSVQKFAGTLDQTIGLTSNIAKGMQSVANIVDGISAKMEKWANTKIVATGVADGKHFAIPTTNAQAWQAQGAHTSHALFEGIGNAGKATWDAFTNPMQYAKNAAAGKYPSFFELNNDHADLRDRIQAGSVQAKPPAPVAVKPKAPPDGVDPEELNKYLKSMDLLTAKRQTQNGELTKQQAIEIAIQEAQLKCKGTLNEQQKSLVAQSATRKYNAEQAEKQRKIDAEHAKVIGSTLLSMDRENKLLALKASGNEKEIPYLKERWALEDKIGTLNSSQLTALNSRIAKQEELNKAIEAEKIQKELVGRIDDAQTELNGGDAEKSKKSRAFEDSIKDLSPARQDQLRGLNDQADLMEEFNKKLAEQKKAHEEAKKDADDLLSKDSEELDKLKAKLSGQEELNELKQKELQIQKMTSLSEDEKSDYIAKLREQATQQKQTNDLLDAQKNILDKIKGSQDGFIAKSQQLKAAFDSGWINLDQYNKEMNDLVNNGKKASDFATNFANSLSKGLSDAVFSGKKLTDTFKDMEKQLLQMAAKKLIFDPASKAIATGSDKLINGVKNFFTGGPSYPQGPLNNNGGTVASGGSSSGWFNNSGTGGDAFADPMNNKDVANLFGEDTSNGDIADAFSDGAKNSDMATNGGVIKGINTVGTVLGDPIKKAAASTSSVADDIHAIRSMLAGAASALQSGGGSGGGGGGSLFSGMNSNITPGMSAFAQQGFARANMAFSMGETYNGAALQQAALQSLGLATGGNVGMGAGSAAGGGGYSKGNGSAFGVAASPMFAGLGTAGANIDANQFWGFMNSFSVSAGGAGEDSTSGKETYGPPKPNFTPYNNGDFSTQQGGSVGPYFNEDAFSAVARLSQYDGSGLGADNSKLYNFRDGVGYLNPTKKGYANGGRPPLSQLVTVGEAGKEAMLFDHPGTIIPNDKLKPLLGGGGGDVSIVVNNHSDMPARADSVNTPSGRQIRVTVGNHVATDIASGGATARAIEKAYGLRRKGAM